MENKQIIQKLKEERKLSHNEWVQIIETFTEDDAAFAADTAREIAVSRFGKKVFFRGIVEYSNICKCDCLYCGIRKSNCKVDRYRLSKEDILECCREGYESGFRTFVLQGGEDGYFTDERLVDIVKTIRESYPDCAITLSVGERSYESYKLLKQAGADRFLRRHESADNGLYSQWHPSGQTLENRKRCLYDLKRLGYQTGCGFMVGAPFQTADHLATDMEFLTEFQPEMVGIGPFIPHCDTPFGIYSAGSVELTLFLLSLTRILLPDALLPATTALGTVRGDGRKLGVLAGCNVVMPNLSPFSVRKKYMLYNDKAGTGDDAKAGVEKLSRQMSEIGYEVVSERGDFKKL